MSAYRMPPECEKRLNDDEDLINGMRVLVQCALGGELPSLPQRGLIFPTPDGPPNQLLKLISPSLEGDHPCNRYSPTSSGAGSLLIQLLIGGLAGLAALIKFRWSRIRAVFSKKPREESNG